MSGHSRHGFRGVAVGTVSRTPDLGGCPPMDEDRIRWDDRYAARSPIDVTGAQPPDALAMLDEGMFTQLPTTGRALDIACGVGAQSLWLAERGLQVVALDVSPVAVELTEAAAAAAGRTDSIDARVHDLDAGLPEDVGGVAVIVCQRFRGRNLYPQIAAALTPGGVAIVTVLSAVGHDGMPGEFHAPAGELVEAFATSAVDIVAQSERDGLASIIVRRR
jgi:SAM-dependent methyltransferase